MPKNLYNDCGNMKKILLLLALLIGGYVSADAQFDWRRLTIGGGLGLQFGDYTLINVSPQVGYDLNRYLNLGVGVNYSHFSEDVNHRSYKLSNNYLGANVYAKAYPVSFIVLMVQPEINRMWRTVKYDRGNNLKENKAVATLLVGGGLRLGPMTAMIQYDLAQNADSPYGNRLFYSIGYTFYFGW